MIVKMLDRLLYKIGLMRVSELREPLPPQPPPQRAVLHGGPFDGKEISVRQGIERVVLPRLADSWPSAKWVSEKQELNFGRPTFVPETYRRDLVNYHYEPKEQEHESATAGQPRGDPEG